MPKELLTRLERETIINFNQEEAFAEVYTHESRFLRRLQKMAIDFPGVCKLTDKSEWGGETYTLPKKLIRIGIPMSEERREAARVKGSLLAKKSNKNPLPEDMEAPANGVGASEG